MVKDIELEQNTYDTISQYPCNYFSKDNFNMYLEAFSRESDEIKQILYNLRFLRLIDSATDIHLDNIGEIVGESRQYSVDIDTGYFTFLDNIYGSGFEDGKWWFLDGNSTVVESRDDNIYRKAIKAKIIRNNGYSTPEEIIQLAKYITNSTNIVYEADYPAGIKIYYDGDLTDQEKEYAGKYIQAALGAGIKLTDIQPIS